MPQESRYEDSQNQRDLEYTKAWARAPKRFKDKAAEIGLEAHLDKSSGAIDLDETFTNVSYTPDMGDTLDTQADLLVERLGAQHEAIIRRVVEEMKIPMQIEAERNRASTLVNIVCKLVKSERRNIYASIHSLLHAIPRLGLINGFPSLRSSARECACSVEWISKSRDEWCHNLGMRVPKEGAKSADAKINYHLTALKNHWRKQTVTITSHLKPKHTTPQCKPKLKPSQKTPIKLRRQLAKV